MVVRAEWKRIRCGAWVAGLSLFSTAANAGPDPSAYLVLTSDYVWRGVTQSDSDPAAQLGGELAFENGIYAGLWASTIDIDNGADRQRDTELTYYLGYSHALNRTWTLGAAVIAYTYPGQTGSVDYNYEELLLSASFADRLWLEYAYTADLYHSGEPAHNIEALAEWSAAKSLVFSAGAGYYDVSDLAGDGYAYWEAGVTLPVNRFDIDLRYHDTSRWVPIVSTPDRADARIVLSVRVSL